MIPANWKKYSAIAISALALTLGEQIVQACTEAPDPGDYYISFFDNKLPVSGNYDLFRYSAYTGMLYESWYVEDNNTDTADGNRAEWAVYTGVPPADVDSFVYSYERPVLAALYANIEKGTPSELLAPYEGNRMVQWFRRSKDLEALGYLMYAKQIQPYANRTPADPWSPAPPPDKSMIEKLRKNGMQLYAAAHKPFIRDRYAYQVERLAFAGANYEDALRIYKEIAPKTNSNISGRALGIEAGALYRLKRMPEAAYRYSLLFDRGEEWRRSAFISYSWTGADTNTAPVLALCKNAHERAVVQVLSGLYAYEPALDKIKAALREDPAVNGLDALVTREINKIEERFITDVLLANREQLYSTTVTPWPVTSYWPAVNEYNDSTGALKKARLEEYRKTTLQLADLINEAAAKNPKSGFWSIAAAYLSLVTGNQTDLEKQLQKAEGMSKTAREKDQISVIKLLSVSRDNGKITPETEKAMLPHIQWLESRRKTSPRLDKTYRDFNNGYLTSVYLRQGDTAKAIFALAHSQQVYQDTSFVYGVQDDFMDASGLILQSLRPEQFEKVKTFATQQGGTAYDRWLRGDGNIYPLAMLLELEGTYRLREHRFADAAAIFRKSNAKALAVHPMPNPFRVTVRDYIEWDAQDSATQINKLQFAEKMAALQPKTDAESRLQYGLGLYGMSYYGKAHRASDYYRSGVDDYAYYDDTSRRRLSATQQQYYNPTEAEKAFVDAARSATAPETKAIALFMAAKCWQKRAPVPTSGRPYSWSGPGENDPYYHNSLKNPYFRQMKAEVGETQFYRQALRSCDYLSDYARRR